jgi:hypothetical protein
MIFGEKHMRTSGTPLSRTWNLRLATNLLDVACWMLLGEYAEDPNRRHRITVIRGVKMDVFGP